MSKHVNSVERYNLISDGFDSLNIFIPAGVQQVATHLLKQLISKDLSIRIRQPKSFKGTITQVSNQLELPLDKVNNYLNDLQSRVFNGLGNASLLSLFGTTNADAVTSYMFYTNIAEYMINLHVENKRKLKEIDERYRLSKSDKVAECLKLVGIKEIAAIERELVTLHITSSSPFHYIEHTDEAVEQVLGINQLGYHLKNFQRSVFKQLSLKEVSRIFGKYTKLRMDDKKFLRMLCEEVCKHVW